jgi:drug/metabolite transporter (DMT)-like permease
MNPRDGRPLLAMTLGAACIAGSAVLMKLAGSSPSMTALLRCVFALPVLGMATLFERRRGAAGMNTASRWLARAAGLFLAADLVLWSHAIDEIGAGLGTVTGNMQVLITALLGWWLLGERPGLPLLLGSPLMLGGLALVGGLAGARSYGADPGLGVVFGLGVGTLYSVYILLLRQATSPAGDGRASVAADASTGGGARVSVAEPLFEATAGAAFGSLLLGFALHDLRLGPAWPALGWLAALALTSQVIGWLLITTSMPRLPAWLVGALLLIQPAGSVALSMAFLGEHPSAWQLVGVAAMLSGVGIVATAHSRRSAAITARDHGNLGSYAAPKYP